MSTTMFRGDDMPAQDRGGHTADPHGSRAGRRPLRLGPVTVWPRDSRTIRHADAGKYHVSSGLGEPDACGRRDLWLSDASRPYEPPLGQGRRVTDAVSVEFPKALVPLPPDRVGRLLGKPLPGRDGTGALLAGFLTDLAEQADAFPPSHAPRLGMVLLDLLLAWLTQLLDAEAALGPETRQQALIERIQDFIRHNLHEPELAPPLIAAAHHISLSYLHRLFGQHSQGETVAAWIRRQRLEGARRDLADPALHTTPVHAIATRWGHHHPADFSRAFRSAYGMPPTKYRLQAPTAQE